MSELPDPVADDAPSPDDVDKSESVEAVARGGPNDQRLVAVDHDGARYCIECANPAYVETCRGDPREIPYGGPVPEGAEIDCPGASCSHCWRKIEGFTVLHYDGVCHPDSCPDMTAYARDPDRVRDPVECAVLERDGGDVKVMLREDFGSHGDRGDESWVPEADVLDPEHVE